LIKGLHGLIFNPHKLSSYENNFAFLDEGILYLVKEKWGIVLPEHGIP
jgi:hypothetical protein